MYPEKKITKWRIKIIWLSIYAEEASDRIQQQFMLKQNKRTANKMGLEGHIST